MNSSRIAELLASYIVGLELPAQIYDQLGAYLDLLLRWNAKTNLTAVRDPEQIVTRHFGESLFAAGVLFGSEGSVSAVSSREKLGAAPVSEPAFPDSRQLTTDQSLTGAHLIPAVGMSGIHDTSLADLGSGAGFPGLPIKLAFPELQVTLIESQNKKATFLKEVIRALQLDGIEVYSGRAEHWGKQAHVVTQRAVEKFQTSLAVARSLVVPGGRLCLLIGKGQTSALAGMAGLTVEVEQTMPNRPDSMVLVGRVR